jgi:hypothetical protein
MKSLSKLHQEAIIKAKTDTDKNKAAAMAMIEKPIEMIKAIMLKHELAVIEVMRELHEKREWVGLTKEEVDSWELPDCPTVFEFVQFIEAKIKEKTHD